MKSESEELIYNPFNERNKELTYDSLQCILNKYNVYYNVQNFDIFKRAFVHKSYVRPSKLNEDMTLAAKPPSCIDLSSHSNERLEFLGDGILENVTKFYLYKRFPEQDEGFMTEKKIALVKNDHIGCLAYKMGLNDYYLMSKNAEEKKTRFNYKKLGCLFEAFLGALFLDANNMILSDNNGYLNNYFGCGVGFQVCQIFIESIFEQLVDWNELLENDNNYKNIFQVMIQKEFKTTPEYYVLNIDEEQKYTMGVYLCLGNVNIHNVNVDDAVDFKEIKTFQNITSGNHSFIFFSKASHKIKKKAEQIACQKAIELIQVYE
jgi:dsRNA-specific ribonuclease